ncbi:MAG: fibronectin type III domain-containing protein [archaeon]
MYNFRVLGVILVLMAFFATSAFAASSIIDFNINNDATYISSTSATLYPAITADANCTMCFSENSDSNVCATYITCASTSQVFTLSSTAGTKTVYLFVKDNAILTTSDSDTITLDNNFPTYSISGVTDGNYYNTTSFTITITPVDNSGIASSAYTLNGSTVTSPISTGTLTDGNHVVTVDLNDVAGNRTLGAFWFVVDTNTPTFSTLTSSYSSSYTNDEEPDFNATASDINWGMTSGIIAFSCASSGTYYTATYSQIFSTFNITSTGYDCNTADGNKIVYVKVRDRAGNWSSVKNVNVLYDNNSPSVPSGLTATAGDRQVALAWTAPSADNLSGNKEYKVYKDGSVYSTTTSTSLTVTGLTNGTSYTFKVATVDNAGNEGSATSNVSATPSGATTSVSVKKAGSIAYYVKTGDSLAIECSYSATADAARIKYRYRSPDVDSQTLRGPTNAVTSLSENHTVISGNYERIEFWCEGTTTETITSGTVTVTIDNVAPTLTWNDTNTKFVGKKRIGAIVTEPFLDKVEILFKGTYMQTTKDTNNGNLYYYDLNTMLYENGSYALKAIAYDKAGNQKSIDMNITIENILSISQKATKAIADAKAKKQEVVDIMSIYSEKGLIFADELTTKKDNADKLLSEAESTVATNATLAYEKASQAKSLYDEIKIVATITPFPDGTKTYDYNSDNLLNQLAAIGLTPATANAAKALIESSGIERKISVFEVGSGKYQANIEITFTNDTNSDEIRILEVIPKELAASASQIYSATAFTVVQEDPVIEFVVPVEKGAKGTVTYGVGEITKEQADMIVQGNLIAKFAAPPVILPEGTTSDSALSPILGGAIAAGMLLFVMAMFALAAVLIVFFAKINLSGKGGFGENKTIFEQLFSQGPAPEKKTKWAKK